MLPLPVKVWEYWWRQLSSDLCFALGTPYCKCPGTNQVEDVSVFLPAHVSGDSFKLAVKRAPCHLNWVQKENQMNFRQWRILPVPFVHIFARVVNIGLTLNFFEYLLLYFICLILTKIYKHFWDHVLKIVVRKTLHHFTDACFTQVQSISCLCKR